MSWLHDYGWIDSDFWLVYRLKWMIFFKPTTNILQNKKGHRMSGPTITVPTLAPLTSSTRSQEALRCLRAGNSASRGVPWSSVKSYFEKTTFPKPVPSSIVLPLTEWCSGTIYCWLLLPSLRNVWCVAFCWPGSIHIIVKLLSTCWFQPISNFFLACQCVQVHQLLQTYSINYIIILWVQSILRERASNLTARGKESHAHQPKWTFMNWRFFYSMHISNIHMPFEHANPQNIGNGQLCP